MIRIILAEIVPDSSMSQTSQNLTRLAQEVIRLAPLAVVVCDDQKVIRIANPRAAQLLSPSQSIEQSEEVLLIGEFASNILLGLNLDRVTDSSTRQKVLIGTESRIFEFQCSHLELDSVQWTIIYFNEADKQRQRELLLEKEASTDALSGLANRRAFQRTMEGNQHRPLSLAIIDVDHFKAVNDTHGHLAGDDLVQFASSMLRRTFDDHAILISRMGGDEFSILFETTSVESIVSSLNDFRKLIAESQLPEHETIRFTASIGVAISFTPGTNTRTLLTHADRQLYRAKAAGRNCLSQVTLDESTPVK